MLSKWVKRANERIPQGAAEKRTAEEDHGWNRLNEISSKNMETMDSQVSQQSEALHLSARGVTTDPGLIPGGITIGRDWESHWAAKNIYIFFIS